MKESISQVLKRYCHRASQNEWSRWQVWPVPRPLGGWQRCYHAGSRTWQLALPLPCCGNCVVSSPSSRPQRGPRPLSEEWRESRMVGTTGQATKNLGKKLIVSYRTSTVTLLQTSDGFKHREYVQTIDRNAGCFMSDRRPPVQRRSNYDR